MASPLQILKLLPVLVLFLGFSSISLCEKVRYDGYKVFRVIPSTREQFELLPELEKLGVIFLEEPSRGHAHVDLLFPPHLQGDLLNNLKSSAGFTVTETISDLQKVIDAEVVNEAKAWSNWIAYETLEEHVQFLTDKAAQFPNIARIFNIGNSFEGNDLLVLRLQKNGFIEPRPVIWIDSNIHAREWVSGAVTTYLIEQLLTNPALSSWLDDFDFFIMPIANPDGYKFSHEGNRLWRKTRSTTDSILGCKGADPNRNFGYKWQTGGSSNVPCDDTYAGKSAFSEPETAAISTFFDLTIAADVKCFISIHSYSQYVIFPYGLNNETLDPEEYARYMDIGIRAAEAISTKFDTEYQVGSITDLLYPASGGSIDWIKAVHKTDLTFAFELRDTGTFGFLLPADQIIPTAEEFIDGLAVFIEELRLRKQQK